MFWRRKSRLGDDLKGWIADSYAWTIERNPNWPAARLVLPTREFFHAPRGEDHEVAVAVVEDVKRLLGLEGVQISVHRQPSLPDGVTHEYGKLSNVAGTYIHDDEAPEISYDPKLLRYPVAFIAVVVHELMHHVLADVIDEVPGGEGAHELATDLHAIIAGFGVIQMRGAAELGWLGYMTQESRAHALALFLRLAGSDVEQAMSFLDGRQAKAVRAALRAFDADPGEIEQLKALAGENRARGLSSGS